MQTASVSASRASMSRSGDGGAAAAAAAGAPLGAGGKVHKSKHRQAEARRRERINERLQALRDLVPHDARSNTASFLEGVVDYIQALQHSNAALEEQLAARQAGRAAAAAAQAAAAGGGGEPRPLLQLPPQQHAAAAPALSGSNPQQAQPARRGTPGPAGSGRTPALWQTRTDDAAEAMQLAELTAAVLATQQQQAAAPQRQPPSSDEAAGSGGGAYHGSEEILPALLDAAASATGSTLRGELPPLPPLTTADMPASLHQRPAAAVADIQTVLEKALLAALHQQAGQLVSQYLSST